MICSRPNPMINIYIFIKKISSMLSQGDLQFQDHSNSSSVQTLESTWHPHSWKDLPALQLPTYEESSLLESILKELEMMPPLTTFEELNKLRSEIEKVNAGEKFIIQLGDCAEVFEECDDESIQRKLQFFQDMGELFRILTQKESVVIGRICGQYAKPRTKDFEREGLYAYKGDLINGIEEKDRKPDPNRLKLGAQLTQQGLKTLKNFSKKQTIFVSHECLHLDYESAFVRKDNESHYGSSAHFLWIGERTRQINGAHMEFVSGLENAVGVKVSSSIQKDEFIQLIQKLNPLNATDKLVIIIRMGQGKIADNLPKLIEWKQKERLNFVWVCDPMHGNTIQQGTAKTRQLKDIQREIEQFIQILSAHGEHPGGLHLEATPFDVYECCLELNDTVKLTYHSACDPRLNYEQSAQVVEFTSSVFKKTIPEDKKDKVNSIKKKISKK